MTDAERKGAKGNLGCGRGMFSIGAGLRKLVKGTKRDLGDGTKKNFSLSSSLLLHRRALDKKEDKEAGGQIGKESTIKEKRVSG